jgi:hypothetical protein
MQNEALARLRSDIINQLQNEKYYLQSDLQHLAESSVSQREKVEGSIALLKEINKVDMAIGLADRTYQIQQAPYSPEPVMSTTPEVNIDADDDELPNVVEDSEETE